MKYGISGQKCPLDKAKEQVLQPGRWQDVFSQYLKHKPYPMVMVLLLALYASCSNRVLNELLQQKDARSYGFEKSRPQGYYDLIGSNGGLKAAIAMMNFKLKNMKYLDTVSKLILRLVHSPGHAVDRRGKPDHSAFQIQFTIHYPHIRTELESAIHQQPEKAVKIHKLYLLELASICKLLKHYIHVDNYADMVPTLKEVLIKLEDIQTELAFMEVA